MSSDGSKVFVRQKFYLLTEGLLCNQDIQFLSLYTNMDINLYKCSVEKHPMKLDPSLTRRGLLQMLMITYPHKFKKKKIVFYFLLNKKILTRG